MCAGERLSLRFGAISALPFRVRTVELIQRHLRQVGVEVVLSFAPSRTLVAQIDRGAIDMVEFA